MIDVRIVCTHDAKKMALTLQRLLSAQDHHVELCTGRASLEALEAARNTREAVILIWSLDAPSAHYMLQWATGIESKRLIEITRAPNISRGDVRKPGVIDFSAWSGERGGSAWRALVERLRLVARGAEPPKPPPLRAAVALGAVSALAMGGAIVLRVDDAARTALEPPPENVIAASVIEDFGMGGPLRPLDAEATEEDAIVIHFRRGARVRAIEDELDATLADLPGAYEPVEFRRDSLFTLLSGMTRPLFGGGAKDSE